MARVRTGHRSRCGALLGAGAFLLVLTVSAVPCSACASADSGREQGAEAVTAGRSARGSGGGEAGDAGAGERARGGGGEEERTIGGRRFVRRGEDWYLVADGQRFRVLPDSLSLRFRDQATPEQRREFLDAHGFEVVRRNRLGIHDVAVGSERHAVEWLAELTGDELLDLVEVNTEGVYAEE